MKLREYLDKHSLTARQFGTKVGWNDSKISRILNGVTSPSLDDMEAVAEVTDSEVDLNDWHRARPVGEGEAA